MTPNANMTRPVRSILSTLTVSYDKPNGAPLRTRVTFCFPRSCLISPVQNSKHRTYRYAIGCSWLLVAAPVEEKYVDFVDSRGLFSCRIPADFLRAERAKDRKGTVFVSGNYNKAGVLSVQSFTAYELLKDAGENQQYYDLGPIGDVHKNIFLTIFKRCSSFRASSYDCALRRAYIDRLESSSPVYLYSIPLVDCQRYIISIGVLDASYF